MPLKSVPIAERFLKFLPSVLDDDECWEWQGSRLKAGYGKILDGPPDHKTLLAHRVSWELHNSAPIPKGMLVCHSCDNPCCVNPSHLYIGSHSDNAADKALRDRCRPVRGEQNGRSKLTAEQIKQIRLAGEAGVLQSTIAADYGVSRQAIHLILVRKNWRHLPGPAHNHAPRPKGSSHPQSKLTEADIVAIREAAKAGETRKSIAARYQVTPESISCIVLRKTWKHVP
jgi:hypothetical protein